MKEKAKAVSIDFSPQEQVAELNQQLSSITRQLAEFKEMLQETKNANKDMESQLSQTK